jgi:S1-C subfamily serine protease
MNEDRTRSMLRPRRFSFLALLAVSAATAVVYEAVAGPSGWLRGVYDLNAQPRAVTQAAELLPDEIATISLFDAASPSVVHIETTELRRQLFDRRVAEIPQGTGSGFIWDERGYLVTNFHVVRGAERILVSGNGFSREEAVVVGIDPVTDLAVVKIATPPGGLRPLPLGSSNQLRVGQNVYAIGNPFGLDQTLTRGIISGIDREIISVSGTTIRGVIQTDAAINPGNSGGPLLDSSGRLIGVNTAIQSPSGASAGIGFAVPVDTVNRVIPQIIRKGTPDRPTLGVGLAPDRWTFAQGIQGVVLAEVHANGPAAQVGLEGLTQTSAGQIVLGDIVRAINGKVVRSENEFLLTLTSYPPGERVTLLVERKGKQREVEVELEARADG